MTPEELNEGLLDGNWPTWSTPEREIATLRAAIHHLARDVVGCYQPRLSEQDLVDRYIAAARLRLFPGGMFDRNAPKVPPFAPME